MNKEKLISEIVLNEIADDYENIDQIIFPSVQKECARLGIQAERSDIVKALADLVEHGLAHAYRLSCREPAKQLEGMPSVDIVEEDFTTYFYITRKGKDQLTGEHQR